MVKKVKSPRKLLFWIFVITCLVFGVIGYYAVQAYNATETETEGITICNNVGKCERSVHIHAEILVQACGREIKVPKNKGKVSQQHTHSEKNLIHYHSRIPVDPNTEKPIDSSNLILKNFFENISIPFSSEQIGNYHSGDRCPDSTGPAEVMMWVNGVANYEFEDYIWKDGDQIKIDFVPVPQK